MLGLLLQPAVADPLSAPPAATGGYGLFLLETLLVLVVVCGLAWAFIRFGVKRLYAAPGAATGGPLRVLARLSLEPRRTLYVIDAAGKTLLVGVGDGGPMAVLAELDEHAVAAALAAQPRTRSFLEVLAARRREATVPPRPPGEPR